jgi:predicted nuclease with TOPRIM domain
MISLEQVQLLESRVSKAIQYVQKLTSDNATLASEKDSLQAKLEANQKRIDELEVLIMRFKEEQGRIEDGIIAALDRLSHFEEAFENKIKKKTPVKKPAAKVREKTGPASKEIFFEIPVGENSEDTILDDSDNNDSVAVDVTAADNDAFESSDASESSDAAHTSGELDIF